MQETVRNLVLAELAHGRRMRAGQLRPYNAEQ